MTMIQCELAHIPPHLHYDEKPLLPEFYTDELLYRRCKPDDLANPFGKISLYDLSVNRQGSPTEALCQPNDVFYVTEPNPAILIHEGYVAIGLRVKEVDTVAKTYEKKFDESTATIRNEVVIRLIHDPLPCNYPHSMLVFEYNGEQVVKSNYNRTLKSKAANVLRDKCRTTIAEMIEKRELWIN